MSEAKWYVVHTYSGYENKVKVDLEKTIENRHLENDILEVLVPTYRVSEAGEGSVKTSDRKMFPGYVLINMVMDDNTWYVVRNTRGVTGFVGPGSKPVPLDEKDIESLKGDHSETYSAFSVGDTVAVITGVWKDNVSTVKSVNESRKTLTINVEMFGGETPVELGFSDVKRV